MSRKYQYREKFIFILYFNDPIEIFVHFFSYSLHNYSNRSILKYINVNYLVIVNIQWHQKCLMKIIIVILIKHYQALNFLQQHMLYLNVNKESFLKSNEGVRLMSNFDSGVYLFFSCFSSIIRACVCYNR